VGDGRAPGSDPLAGLVVVAANRELRGKRDG